MVDGSGMEVDRRTDYDPLSEVLWRERSLLARLVFKLAVVRILLVAEGYRWLPMAADEVAGITDELDSLTTDRQGLVGQHAPTLLDLALAAPTPWAEILHDHRQSLLLLRDQARRGAMSTAQTLAATSDYVTARVKDLEEDGCSFDGQILRLACAHLRNVTDRAAASVPADYGR
jgi:hypothetical protein